MYGPLLTRTRCLHAGSRRALSLDGAGTPKGLVNKLSCPAVMVLICFGKCVWLHWISLTIFLHSSKNGIVIKHIYDLTSELTFFYSSCQLSACASLWSISLVAQKFTACFDYSWNSLASLAHFDIKCLLNDLMWSEWLKMTQHKLTIRTLEQSLEGVALIWNCILF